LLDATVDPPTAALLTQLADWVNEHGSAEVPQSGRSRLDPPGERPLGKRLYYARSKYARGTLPAPVTRALKRFPGWTWTPYQATLDRHLAALDTHFRVQDRTTRLGLPADTYAWLNSASHRGISSRASPALPPHRRHDPRHDHRSPGSGAASASSGRAWGRRARSPWPAISTVNARRPPATRRAATSDHTQDPNQKPCSIRMGGGAVSGIVGLLVTARI